MTGNDDLQHWPCQSSHRVTISVGGVEPLTITLPYPIIPDTTKATLRQRERTVELIVDKSVNDIWPEDVIPNQFRWNPYKLEPWMDMKTIYSHLNSQYPFYTRASRDTWHEARVLNEIRAIITNIFHIATTKEKFFFQLRSKRPESGQMHVEFFLLVHLPIRISPRGAPIVLLSILDQEQVQWCKRRRTFVQKTYENSSSAFLVMELRREI